MKGRRFVATFHPLIRTAFGRRATEAYALPPFVDGSCRREPDFESPFPAITALCRGRNFAPRLRPGDAVLYLTVKGRYLNDRSAGWRVVAALRVLERLESHEAAANWYKARGIPLPSNCLVDGNGPMRFEHTHGHPRGDVRRRGAGDPERTVRLWDAAYRRRVSVWPALLVCKATFLHLHTPPQVRERDLTRVFGRVPGTRTPPEISRTEFAKVLRLAR